MKSSQILIKRRRLSVLPQIVLLIGLLTSCYQTYHLSNGEKYKNFFPVDDNYIISKAELGKSQFDLELFKNPDSIGRVQFVFAENVFEIVDSLENDLLLIFYFPNCSGADKEVEIAKFAEDSGIPVILISDTYSPARMEELYEKYTLINRNQYIIPTTNKKDDIILKKHVDFIKALSPEYYGQLKDDLIFTTVLRVKKNHEIVANPVLHGGFRTKDYLINWIKQQYGLRTE